jgi:hypothetical protein
MKTPKRTCRDCLFFTSYSFADPDGRCGEGCGTYGTHTKGSEAACNAFMLSSAAKSARRKRKNRVKQLKRSLEKYKYGTHLSGSVGAAYRQLQCLVRPGKTATIAEWANYLKELRQIQEHITCAIANTAIILAYDAERKVKERKEYK